MAPDSIPTVLFWKWEKSMNSWISKGWTRQFGYLKNLALIIISIFKEIIKIKLLFFLFISFNIYLKYSLLSPNRWDIQVILLVIYRICQILFLEIKNIIF